VAAQISGVFIAVILLVLISIMSHILCWNDMVQCLCDVVLLIIALCVCLVMRRTLNLMCKDQARHITRKVTEYALVY
jgi:ABC-type transport system involved in cytochrome bd biosynthesis fused ATPase/permease subunit